MFPKNFTKLYQRVSSTKIFKYRAIQFINFCEDLTLSKLEIPWIEPKLNSYSKQRINISVRSQVTHEI